MKRKKSLRVALIQLNVESDGWWSRQKGEGERARCRRVRRVIRSSLEVARDGGADLALFPECFPFDDEKTPVPIKKAYSILRNLGSLPFIAGGYVHDGSHPRNAVWLIDRQGPELRYFKRVRWGGEPITPGPGPELWTLGSTKIVPLICADVFGAKGKPKRALRELESRLAGIRGLKPDLLVVPSYAKGVDKERWQSHLKLCASSLKVPLAFCNIAGKDKKGFGGGGSAMYRWDGNRTELSEEPGINVYAL